MSWLSCKEYSKRASRSLDEQLSTYDRLAYLFHHGICMACRRFSRQIKVIDLALKCWCDGADCEESATHGEGLSSERKSRIKEALDQQHSADPH